MKKLLFVTLLLITALADAKGGFSGGGRGGFSGGGGGRSFSAPSRSFSAPSAPSRGGFSSAPSPARPTPSAAPRTSTTTTTTTTTSRRSYSGGYGGQYVSPGPMYGGWGMGYGYSNGLLTGMIIGNMMHPHNTVMYAGPGAYSNNALLYPDGRVVNQQGYVVGTYQNGQFTAVENGAMAAQPVPADAQVQPAPQPVVIQKTGPSAAEIVGYICLTIIIIILFVILLGVIL